MVCELLAVRMAGRLPYKSRWAATGREQQRVWTMWLGLHCALPPSGTGGALRLYLVACASNAMLPWRSDSRIVLLCGILWTAAAGGLSFAVPRRCAHAHGLVEDVRCLEAAAFVPGCFGGPLAGHVNLAARGRQASRLLEWSCAAAQVVPCGAARAVMRRSGGGTALQV